MRLEGERSAPVRPSLGIFFLPALCGWVAVVAVEAAMWFRFAGDSRNSAAVFAAAGFAALALCAVLRWRHCSFLPALAAIAAGSACALLYWGAWAGGPQECAQALEQDGAVFELTSDAVQRDYGLVSEVKLQGASPLVRARMVWPEGAEPLSAGHAVMVQGSLPELKVSDSGRWNHRAGFAGTVTAFCVQDLGAAPGLQGLVSGFRDDAMGRLAAVAGDGGGFLAGVLLGNRTRYAGTEMEQAFRTTGLAHLMAVSGTHLAVVSALASAAAAKLLKRRSLRVIAVLSLLVGYVVLTGFCPSAMRAMAMYGACMASGLMQRRKDAPNALWACVVAFLCLDPALAFDMGFQLSVAAVAGIALLAPLVAAWMRQIAKGRLAPAAEELAATLCASMGTLPLTVPVFAQLPLITPVATLAAAPLLTACLYLGVPALLLAGPLQVLGDLLLKVCGALANMCVAFVKALAKLPFACLPVDAGGLVLGVLLGGAAVTLWVFWPQPGKGRREPLKLGACLAAVLLAVLACGLGGLQGCIGAAVPSAGELQVVMLDVGQGDAMLIRDGSAAVLVDTGQEGSVLLKALARNGVSRLDAVILSHKDADHTGALASLAGVVPVDHVLVHEGLLDYEGEELVRNAAQRACANGLEGVIPGSTVRAGRFELRLLGPQDAGRSENEDSLVWLLTCDADQDGRPDLKGLLTGDAEEEALRQLCCEAGDVDFVKVGHHGSRGAFSAEELEVLKPEVALISVGAGNEYGHPVRETLELLEDAGARVLRTDLSGDVRLFPAVGGFNVGVQH